MTNLVKFPLADNPKLILETLAVEWLHSGLATAFGWKADDDGDEHLLVLGGGHFRNEALIYVVRGIDSRHFIALDDLGLIIASGSAQAVVGQLRIWAIRNRAREAG